MKRTLLISVLVLLLLISATALVSPLQAHWYGAQPSAGGQLLADAAVSEGNGWGGTGDLGRGNGWGG